MKIIRKIGPLSAFMCLALASSVASAATWTYSSTSPVSNSGLTATATAFSAANSSTATIAATTAYYGGGLGVTSKGESTSSPQHAIDNNGVIETVMLSFSDGVSGLSSADKVNLTSVKFGWASGDSDFSVYAYTGSSSTPSPSGLSYASLTSNGWMLIGQYNGGSSAASYNLNTSVYSSNWLIGANNGLGTSRDTGDDYFKLAGVTGTAFCADKPNDKSCGGGTPGGVPEPGTLLLMGAGFLGLTRISRRKAA
jgi:hypothetical protein